MKKAFFSILHRDLVIYYRNLSEFISVFLFFALITILFLFILNNDEILLKKIGISVIWINVLLSILISLEGLFRLDYSTGILENLLLSSHPTSFLIFAKIIAFWLANILPIIFLTPFIGYLFYLNFKEILILLISLLLGTPTLVIVGILGVSLTLVLYRGGVLLAVLVLPFYLPVLIFGVSSILFFIDGCSPLGHFLILLVFNLFFNIFGPFFISMSLRVSCNL